MAITFLNSPSNSDANVQSERSNKIWVHSSHTRCTMKFKSDLAFLVYARWGEIKWNFSNDLWTHSPYAAFFHRMHCPTLLFFLILEQLIINHKRHMCAMWKTVVASSFRLIKKLTPKIRHANHIGRGKNAPAVNLLCTLCTRCVPYGIIAFKLGRACINEY